MTEQEMKKSVEKMVDDILKNETAEQATPPVAEAQAAPATTETVAKSEEPAKEEIVSKAKEEMEDEEHEEKESAAKEKKEKKSEKKMKKSIEELSDILDEDELELIKAWREDAEVEQVAKSEETAPAAEPAAEEEQEESITKSLAKVMEEAVAPLKKALDEKDALIKSMNEKIEKMASQPAYDRRSISNLEALEKSGASSEGAKELSKRQISEKMFEMQVAGKGVTSHHIAEFEATGNISDEIVKSIVFKELKLS